jgi:D-glucosaminate-6-phosphate ammonia-lyase
MFATIAWGGLTLEALICAALSLPGQGTAPARVIVLCVDAATTTTFGSRAVFFSSKSRHTLFIEQDGNWIQGSHQGDFTVRDMIGMVEGNEVKLRSVERRPGSSVTFIFSGTVSGDTISGPIHMGEYLNATFTAKKHSYPTERTRIVVPNGRPLAT